MKKQLKKYFTLFLVFNILLASNGFAFQKQLCKIKNESKISFTDSKCCKSNVLNENASLKLVFNKSSCCCVLKIKNQNCFQYFQSEKNTFKNLTYFDSRIYFSDIDLYYFSKETVNSKFSKKPPLLTFHFDSSFLKSFLI